MKYLSTSSKEKKIVDIFENSNFDNFKKINERLNLEYNIKNMNSLNNKTNLNNTDNINPINNNNYYFISRDKKDINIFENYIKNDNMGNSLTTYNLFNNTSRNNFPFDSKLHYQLIRKRKERSSCYNFLLLTTFNLNISHFCFPYLLSQIGLINLIIILFICGFFSYLVHSGLIEFVSGNKEISNLNFADLIKSHFGSFCAWFVEIGMIFWFIYNMGNFYISCNKSIF